MPTEVSPSVLKEGAGRCLQRTKTGRREIAGNAVNAGAVRAVRRQIDLDDRIIEPGIFSESLRPTGASSGSSMMPS